jgi:hypothetical protein
MGWECLWTAFCSFPDDIWVWSATVEWHWNGKTEELGEKPIQCRYVQHESYKDWPAGNLNLLGETLPTNCHQYRRWRQFRDTVSSHQKAKTCPTTRHEGGWVENRYSPKLVLILELGTRWGWLVSVTPRPRFSPGTHCTGGWVGPRTGVDTEVRGKMLNVCKHSQNLVRS